MRHRRIRPCRPPDLPAPSLLPRIRRFRRPPEASFHGWVDDVDGDTLTISAYEAGGPDRRLRITIGIGQVRPTERAHMGRGTYVVLEVRKGARNSPRRRFPLRLARTGRWTGREIERARDEGRRLADELAKLVVAEATDPWPT